MVDEQTVGWGGGGRFDSTPDNTPAWITIKLSKNSAQSMASKSIAIISSSIANGRIYFPADCVKFFPADSFGDRSDDGHKGVPVIFEAAGEEYSTDIRVSSSKRLSPRASFKRFLEEARAVDGDLLHVERTADRRYRLSHQPA